MISETAHSECVRLLELLINPRVQESWSWVFMTPVNIPGYDQVIKKPMDLTTIKKNLGIKPSRCRFKSHEKFARDVRLVFNNALTYNKDDQDLKGSVYAAAQHLLRVFETAYAKAIDNVFKADDAAKAAHREAKEEKRRIECSTVTNQGGEGGDLPSLSTSYQHLSNSNHHSNYYHHSREDAEEGSKHKLKHSKKDKKSKKSKKKSKDRDKESRHSSASIGEVKKKHHQSDHKSGYGSLLKDTSAAIVRDDVHLPVPSTSALSLSTSVKGKQEMGSAQASQAKMADAEVSACLSLLMKLIKYKEGNISPAAPFLQPVDLNHFPDYRIKVPNRMHLYGVQKKLRSGSYSTIDAFAYDTRLIFSNCLVYNSDVILSKVMRNHAVTLMKLFESLFVKIGGSWPGTPQRWKCHQVIHEILAHRTAGQETAQWFKYPIVSYYDSVDQIPYNYYKVVKEPMDIGTVSSKLHLGEYKSTSEFIAGMKLIFDNCITYWKSDPLGQTYCESAETLLRVLRAQSSNFGSIVSSSGASIDKNRSIDSSQYKHDSHSSSSLPSSMSTLSGSGNHHEIKIKTSSRSGKSSKSSKSSKLSKSRDTGSTFPEKDVCLEIMKQLRAHKMKGFRGIEIKTAGPFLTAVDTTKYPDYLTIVSEPMNFAKIERKLKSDRYGSVDEFSADVHLIFSNCHKYNSDPVEGADIRAMATNLRTYFVELCNEKFGPLDGTSNSFVEMPAQVVSTSSSLNAKQFKQLATPSKAPEDRIPTAVVSSMKPVKKSFTPSPVKKPSPISTSATYSSYLAARGPKQDDKTLNSELPIVQASNISVKSVTPLKIKPSSLNEISSASGTTRKVFRDDSSLADLTPEEAKRLRKEMKEKRKKEKREKKEKKKKGKEKKRDKKDRKGRSKTPAPQEIEVPAKETSAASTASASSVVSLSAPNFKLPPTVPAPILSLVATKEGPEEPTLATSLAPGKKSKKHKKSDLTSWESCCDRVLNRLSKIEQVSKLHFDHPLLEVFPQLSAEYKSLISEPMDLRTLREQLHAHLLTQAEFLYKGRLIFQNAVRFNCADDPASVQVRDMSTHLLWYFDSLCAELLITSVPEVTGEQSRAKRDQLRRERAEFVSTVPVEMKAKECQKLLRVLNSQKYDKNCWPFRKPVRVLFPALSPDYFDIVKIPMDLSTIAEKLTAFEYKMHGEFIRDVRLTFENAMIYNRADKEREGWSVYSAAVHMLAVVDDLWGDVTLEITEKTRRRESLRKERLNESKRKRSDMSDEREKKAQNQNFASDVECGQKHYKSSKFHPDGVAATATGSVTSVATLTKRTPSIAPVATSTSVVGTIVVSGANGSREDANLSDATSTRVKLQLMPSRPNMERMNKQERKAEEKRRKRARREEEMARTEKRRRTAVAATDDALREAESRSRRRLQKLELVEAARLREERERRITEEEAEHARLALMKLNAAAWTGVLLPTTRTSRKRTGFWAKKHTKLQIPAAFQSPAINA